MAEPVSRAEHAFAYDVITKQMNFLVNDGVPVEQVMTRVVPAYLAPPPECPACGLLWEVRSSRPANKEETLYHRTMWKCACETWPVILVSAKFVKRRKKKKRL